MVPQKIAILLVLVPALAGASACSKKKKGGGDAEELLGAIEPVPVSTTPTGGGGGGGPLILPGSRTPPAVYVTKPAQTTIASGDAALAIEGECETGAKVLLGGDYVAQTSCVNNLFRLAAPKDRDGVYTFTVRQKDSGDNESPPVTITWTRDTVTPPRPTITEPAASPRYTRALTLTVAGACYPNAVVALSGDVTAQQVTTPSKRLTQTCANGRYSFVVSKTGDGVYDLQVAQTNMNNGRKSPAATLRWVRDTVSPARPTITQPSGSPALTSGALTLSGACETDAYVLLGGDVQTTDVTTPVGRLSTVCVASSYSFTLQKSVAGTYDLTVAQVDRAGNASSSASLAWVVDRTPPSAPTITTPATAVLVSNQPSLTLGGDCETGATVRLGGQVLASQVTFPAGSLTRACSGGSYGFTIAKPADGTFNLVVSQTDAAGNASTGVATLTWVRDTTPPAIPTITAPAQSTFHSRNNTMTITGGCESGATVTLGGAAAVAADVVTPAGSLTTDCTASTYAFTVRKTSDGTYPFTVTQADAAGNAAPGVASRTWERDSAAPAAPVVTTPATSPFVSSGGSVTIGGTCEEHASVSVSGDASPAPVTCSGGAFSLSIPKATEGTFTFDVRQTDRAGNASPFVSIQWTRDTTPPDAPELISPSTSSITTGGDDLTIIGACEEGATVSITGDHTAQTACGNDGTFTFAVNKTSGTTFTFSLRQTDAAGLQSPATSLTWTRDTFVPAAPTVTTPAGNPHHSNGASLTIAGGCTDGFDVKIDGATAGEVTSPSGQVQQPCSGGAYSFTFTKSGQQTYTLSLTQINTNTSSTSGATSIQWVRDTTAPAAPTITTPAASPYHSNGSSLTVAGACEPNATVTLSGVLASDVTTPAGSLTRTCSAGGAYSFIIAKTSDGTYTLGVAQTDRAGNASTGNPSVQWTRDTVAPAVPVITSPAQATFYSGSSSLTVSGTCEAGTTVTIGGDTATADTSCAGGTFSFSVGKTADGTYELVVRQRDEAGNESSAALQRWIRDTVAPAAPTITAPATSPYLSNGASLTIAGGCEPNATVSLSGASSSTTTCSGAGTYSFLVSRSTDGTYDYTVTQADVAGNPSGAVSVRWIRDTVPPAAPALRDPAVSPHTTGDTALTMVVGCETGATVTVTGSLSTSKTCAAGETFFTFTPSQDGTYDFALRQTDPAGNISSARALQWVRDTSIPPAPTVTSPTSPFYSKVGTLQLRGGCVAGNVVHLGGDVAPAEVTSPSGALSTTCTSGGAYAFDVSKSAEGRYNLTVTQENTTSEAFSADRAFTWIYDATAPATVLVLSPSASPYSSSGDLLLQGTCEPFATVDVAGDATVSGACTSDGRFSLTVSKSVDATYNMTIRQTDRAGNVSAGVSWQWTRNSGLPATPRITLPGTNPYVSGTSQVTLSGTCTTGLTVTLSGDVVAGDVSSPASSLTATCSSGVFSFTLSKTIDDIYDLHIRQSSGGNHSGSTTLRWIRDAAPPQTSIDAQPPATNLSLDASFAFSCNEGECSFECSLDGEAYAACSSPVLYSALPNGARTFAVRAIDLAGNIDDTPASDGWTQHAHKTIALYHLDTGAIFSDASNYDAAYKSPLTDNGTTGAASSAAFGQGRTLNGTSASLPAAHVATQQTIGDTMSVEAMVSFASTPNNAGYVIASKSGGNGNLGWELKVYRQGNKYYYRFTASLNGTQTSFVRSTPLGTITTNTWHHVAMTWNRGAVKFFWNGEQRGTGTIGTAGQARLFPSTAALRFGASEAGGTVSNFLSGALDEIRVSQVVRWSAGFTKPSLAYGAGE